MPPMRNGKGPCEGIYKQTNVNNSHVQETLMANQMLENMPLDNQADMQMKMPVNQYEP